MLILTSYHSIFFIPFLSFAVAMHLYYFLNCYLIACFSSTCPFNLSLKNISTPLNDIDNFEIFVSTDLGATLIPFIFTGITTNTVSISTSSMRIYIQPASGEILSGAVAQFQLINSS